MPSSVPAEPLQRGSVAGGLDAFPTNPVLLCLPLAPGLRQGWPALLLMVYAREESYNRDSFVSYGLVPLPSTPGCHKVSCNTWFAVESNRALGRTFFGGAARIPCL